MILEHQVDFLRTFVNSQQLQNVFALLEIPVGPDLIYQINYVILLLHETAFFYDLDRKLFFFILRALGLGFKRDGKLNFSGHPLPQALLELKLLFDSRLNDVFPDVVAPNFQSAYALAAKGKLSLVLFKRQSLIDLPVYHNTVFLLQPAKLNVYHAFYQRVSFIF